MLLLRLWVGINVEGSRLGFLWEGSTQGEGELDPGFLFAISLFFNSVCRERARPHEYLNPRPI